MARSPRPDDPLERWPDDLLLRAAQKGNLEAYRVFCNRSLRSLVRALRAACGKASLPKDWSDSVARCAIDFALVSLASHFEESKSRLDIPPDWLYQIGLQLLEQRRLQQFPASARPRNSRLLPVTNPRKARVATSIAGSSIGCRSMNATSSRGSSCSKNRLSTWLRASASGCLR
jgi:hypothetical protein